MTCLSLSGRHRSFSCPDASVSALPGSTLSWDPEDGVVPSSRRPQGASTCALRWPTQGFKLGEPLADLVPTWTSWFTIFPLARSHAR